MTLWDKTKICLSGCSASIIDLLCGPVCPVKYLTDAHGRKIIIHGLNLCNASKRTPGHLPWHTYEDYKRMSCDWGFNGVRLLVFWSDIQPSGEYSYNSNYVKAIAGIINKLKSLGVWVVVDFHQDLYAEQFGGDGAPKWAIPEKYRETTIPPQGIWALSYLHPAVIHSFTEFWKGPLNITYRNMISKVMEDLDTLCGSGPSNIIAVDIINEPFQGQILNFENTALSHLYKNTSIPCRYRKGIEPSIIADAGLSSHLQLDASNDVFMPHFYDPIFQATGYNFVVSLAIKHAVRRRALDANKLKCPLLFGEFGAGGNITGNAEYTRQFMDECDKHQCGWMWYSFDKDCDSDMGVLTIDMKERPILNTLIQIYPRVIAGDNPVFKTSGNKFTLTYNKNPVIIAPTEIFIPPRFKNVTLKINGKDEGIVFNPARPYILNIPTTENNMKVEIAWMK